MLYEILMPATIVPAATMATGHRDWTMLADVQPAALASPQCGTRV